MYVQKQMKTRGFVKQKDMYSTPRSHLCNANPIKRFFFCTISYSY